MKRPEQTNFRTRKAYVAALLAYIDHLESIPNKRKRIHAKPIYRVCRKPYENTEDFKKRIAQKSL